MFDSGVGGLTVLRAIQRALPRESTIYLGDLARCPYGVRAQSQVREFAFQIADMLLRQDVKLLVVACNTATAAAYADLQARCHLPVVGVIDPGATAALRLSRRGRIGVVATQGTVASGAYTAAITRADPEALVEERAASWLVPLIERGSLAHDTVARGLDPVLAGLRPHGIDVLILGCTHFPLVREIFEAGVGPDVAVLDSAETTALEVSRLLDHLDLRSDGPATHRLLVTGPAEAFAERAQAMFHASPLIETVDFSLDPVP